MAVSNIQLGVTETTLHVAGAAETVAILGVYLCNLDTVSHTVTLYAYPDGSSAGDTTTIIKELNIPAKDSYQWTANDKLVLAPLDKISGLADTAAQVSAMVNYFIL
jgi:hypothetical protein